MYSRIAENKRKTYLLMITFILLIGGLGWIFGLAQNSTGLSIGILIGAIIYAIIMYYSSSKLALGLSGAKEISRTDNQRLWNIVENTAITAGLPMPKVYIIDDPAPNAFATGRDPDHAAVAATTGILDMLEDTELEGVMAHEMSHVGNYDIRVNMIVLALVAVIGLISDIFLRMMWFGGRDRNASPIFIIIGIAAAILTPIVAMAIRLAVSRQREYLADASGALLTRYPEGLANALRKISSYQQPMRHANNSTAHLFFANPLKKKKGSFSKFFATHPPTEERVARLLDMGNEL